MNKTVFSLVFLAGLILFSFRAVGDERGDVQLKPECAVVITSFLDLANAPTVTTAATARSVPHAAAGPQLEVEGLESVAVAPVTGDAPGMAAEFDALKRQVAALENRGPGSAKAETGTITVPRKAIDLALEGMNQFFEAVYGVDFVREIAPPLPQDPLVHDMRSALCLIRLSDRACVPLDVHTGIEAKAAGWRAKIDVLRKKIAKLRESIGPSAEYLTPSALAALDIFRDVGRQRLHAGASVRAALRPVAEQVKHNLDDMFHGLTAGSIFDDAQRDLLILVAKLVRGKKIDPNVHAKVHTAVHDLIVSSFALSDPLLEETSLVIFRDLYSGKYGPLDPATARDLRVGVERVAKWQMEVQRSLEVFARGYYRGRIAANVLALMTKPNGYAGIPLNSPLSEAMSSIEAHPLVYSLAVRVYGKNTRYLSLRLGELVSSADDLSKMASDGQADRVFLGRFITDDRLYSLFLRGYVYELEQAVELLEMAKAANAAGTWAAMLQRFKAKEVDLVRSKAEFLGKVMPGRLIQALVLNAEAGGSTDTDHIKKEEFQQGAIRPIPVNLPDFLTITPNFFVWENASTPISTPSIPVPPVAGPAPADERGAAEVAATELASATAAAGGEPVTRAVVTGAAAGQGGVDNYLWDVLARLEARARALLEEDHAIQSEHEGVVHNATGPQTTDNGADGVAAPVGHKPMDQARVLRLQTEVEKLLYALQKVHTRMLACFRAGGLSEVDEEHTLAWHLIHDAPTLAMYAIIGPPTAPNHQMQMPTALSGLSWRLIMMAPRIAYGDGSAEKSVFASDPVNPEGLLRRHRAAIASAVLGIAATVGVQYGGPPAMRWIESVWPGTVQTTPETPATPVEPVIEVKPGETPKPKEE